MSIGVQATSIVPVNGGVIFMSLLSRPFGINCAVCRDENRSVGAGGNNEIRLDDGGDTHLTSQKMFMSH